MKRWIAIAFLAFAWLHDGFEGMEWKRRALASEERAERAEAWAEVVEEEAELHLAEMSDSFRRAPAAEKRQAPETDCSAMEVEP